jgi:hypothetical protein
MTAPTSNPMAMAVERIVLGNAGRGIEGTKTRYSFTLHRLVRALTKSKTTPVVGLLSGFPVLADGELVDFENDGPIGAAHIAAAAAVLDWRSLLISDAIAQPQTAAIAEVVAAHTNKDAPHLVTLPPDTSNPETEAKVRAELDGAGMTHLIAIERPGRARDGQYYNMRAKSISAHFASTDFLFQGAPWATAAFADGGNEIGMGNIAAARIGRNVAHGKIIASRTKVDFLTICGVSNWGAYGLVAMLAHAVPQKRAELMQILSADFDLAVFSALKAAGSIDGVTGAPTQSVDGLDLDIHHKVIAQLRDAVLEHA